MDKEKEKTRAKAILFFFVTFIVGIIVFAIVRHYLGVVWGLVVGFLSFYIPWGIVCLAEFRSAGKNPSN